MVQKKTPAKSKNAVNTELVKAIREDLLPLFEKQDRRFDEMDKKFTNLSGQVERQGADIVKQKEEILAALDGIASLLPQKEIVKDLEVRVESLEQSMGVVKTAIRSFSKA